MKKSIIIEHFTKHFGPQSNWSSEVLNLFNDLSKNNIEKNDLNPIESQLLDAAYDASLDAIILIKDDKIVDCNKKALSMFKIKDKALITNLTISQLMPKEQPYGFDSLTFFEKNIRKAIDRGMLRFEWSFIDLTNKIFPCEVVISLIKYGEENILQVIIHNIINRKEIEKSLKSIRLQQKAMLDNLPFMAWLKDKRGVFTAVNEPFAKYYNMKKSDMVGKSDFDLLPLELAQLFESEDKNVLEKGENFVSEKIVKFHEEHFWLETFKKPIIDDSGEIVGLTGIARDITDKKSAEIALRESETLFKSYFDLPLIGIAIADLNYNFVSCNQKFMDIVGYSEPEILQNDWKNLIYENEPNKTDDLFNNVIDGSMNAISIECKCYTKLGKKIDVSLCTTVILDDNSFPRFFFTICSDITERKIMENELNKLMDELKNINVNLEVKIKEEVNKNREKDLILSQQSKQAALGEMMSNIAHQWRQPLNAVSIIIQNIQDAYNYNELTTQYMQEKVEKAMKIIKNMSSTIDDFRNYFHPDKELQEFSVKNAVEDTLFLLDATFKNFNISINTNYINDSVLKVNFNEYSQVVLNILNNAKDALIQNKIENPYINIELNNVNGVSILKIFNNAGKIDKTLLNRIFEPYYTTKHQGFGTGLGLYISKNIIEKNMNGKIFVENKENGVEFTIQV